jgi:primosomal protein N' (replication factor Y)
VQALFPQARTLRWDYETTRQKGAHDLILNQFASQRADILVGTQMIAKGLDLPLVTLVGVVLADVGLSLPDLRAAERTFQVLTQVAGQTGAVPWAGR